MAGIFDDLKAEWRRGDLTLRLVFVNTIVFLFINILLLLFEKTLAGNSLLVYVFYLASSSDLWYVFAHPWSVITHMFAHENFSHWLWNMVALYFSGQVFNHFFTKQKLLATYLAGGLAGFVLYLIAFNIFPSLGAHGSVLGASAAIMAIFLAAAATAPEFEISIWGVIRVKMKYVAAVYVILDFVSLRNGWNSGGHIAHLGGALYGFMYARQLKEGRDIGSWMEYLVIRIFYRPQIQTRARNKVRVSPTKLDEDFNITKKQRQKKVDDILDKISHAGYDSLTKDEKEFLFKYSQK